MRRTSVNKVLTRLSSTTPKFLLLSSIFFASGLFVFWKAKREQGHVTLFVGWEKAGAIFQSRGRA